MDLFNKIHLSIYELESLNCKRENIKITTSFIIKKLFEEAVSNYAKYEIAKLSPHGSRIFGVDISFNHFENNIVVYDETIACIDERFKIIITPEHKFVAKIS